MVRSLKDRRGKYGYAKLRAFSSLEGREWIPSRELLLLSGLHYHSLSRLLLRWLSWGYVARQPTYKFGIGSYEYKLLARGEGWLEAARCDLPAAGQFGNDLQDWWQYIIPKVPTLMAGKFKDVLAALPKG